MQGIMQHQNNLIIMLIIQILSIFTLLISSLLMIKGDNVIPPNNNNNNNNNNNLASWCKQTPYSEQCEYYLTQNKDTITFPIKAKQDFVSLVIQSAMENLMQAHQNAYSLSTNFENDIEKALWKDCLDLYELAIDHLNQTMTNTKCTKFDTQTWLSTALTSHQSCQNGFHDLNLENKFMQNNPNISSLISNALAINNNDGIMSSKDDTAAWTDKDGFPGWVRPGDRKLLQSMGGGDIVVAQDGSGDYSSIGQAVSAASSKSKGGSRFVIYIKTGNYKENINIGLTNIMLKGDGIGKTIITGSKSVGGGATTFRSATVAVMGSGFMAQGITFMNTAGPSNHQAVALRSNSDLSVFYQCSFEGYQDTLYVFANRQFYRECNIYGTVDFIFGNAAVVLQNCNILTRHPPNGLNTLTAQGRTDPNQNTGIIIHNSKVSAAESQNGANTYLGRPWQKYSRTVFMKTYLDSIVNPMGWYPWSGNFALSTLYYAEYANTGPGSSTGGRVSWPGYHVLTSASEAGKFTVGNFIAGGSWLPNTDVPFTSGL